MHRTCTTAIPFVTLIVTAPASADALIDHLMRGAEKFGAPDRALYVRMLTSEDDEAPITAKPPTANGTTAEAALQRVMTAYLDPWPKKASDEALAAVREELSRLQAHHRSPAVDAFACRVSANEEDFVHKRPWLLNTGSGQLAGRAPAWCKSALVRHPEALACLGLKRRLTDPIDGIYAARPSQRPALLRELSQDARKLAERLPCALAYRGRAERDLGDTAASLETMYAGARAGDPNIQVQFGEALWHGRKIGRNRPAAIENLTRASRLGHGYAIARLAIMRLIGLVEDSGFAAIGGQHALVQDDAGAHLRDDVRFRANTHQHRRYLARVERVIADAQRLPAGLEFFDGPFRRLVQALPIPLPTHDAR